MAVKLVLLLMVDKLGCLSVDLFFVFDGGVSKVDGNIFLQAVFSLVGQDTLSW